MQFLVNLKLHFKVLDIASPVFMSNDLTKHVSYMFYGTLYPFNSKLASQTPEGWMHLQCQNYISLT